MSTPTAVDVGARLVAGWGCRWETVGISLGGPLVLYAAGSLRIDGLVRALRDHDPARIVGRAVEVVAHEEGLLVALRMARTPAGDEALTLAAEGCLPDLSVGVRAVEHEVVDVTTGGKATGGKAIRVTGGLLHEVSLVAEGRIPGACVTFPQPPAPPVLELFGPSTSRLLRLAAEARTHWDAEVLRARAAEVEHARRVLVKAGCPAATADQAAADAAQSGDLAGLVQSGDRWRSTAAGAVAGVRGDSTTLAAVAAGGLAT